MSPADFKSNDLPTTGYPKGKPDRLNASTLAYLVALSGPKTWIDNKVITQQCLTWRKGLPTPKAATPAKPYPLHKDGEHYRCSAPFLISPWAAGGTASQAGTGLVCIGFMRRKAPDSKAFHPAPHATCRPGQGALARMLLPIQARVEAFSVPSSGARKLLLQPRLPSMASGFPRHCFSEPPR